MKLFYFLAVLLLVFGLLFFIAIYESIFWIAYEGTAADHITYIIAIPFLIYFSAVFFREKYKYDLSDDNGKVWPALKASLMGLVGIAILYRVTFTPIISGAILISNSLIGKQERVQLYGKVIRVHDKYSSAKQLYDCSIIVRTRAGKELTLEMSTPELHKHAAGSTFNEYMMKGAWGFLYQCETD